MQKNVFYVFQCDFHEHAPLRYFSQQLNIPDNLEEIAQPCEISDVPVPLTIASTTESCHKDIFLVGPLETEK